MQQLIDILIISVAAGRIAFSLVRDDIFAWLRNFVMRIDWRRTEDVSLTGLFHCYYCMSAWVSFVPVVTYLIFGDVIVTLCLPFAAWGVANLVAGALDNE